MPIVDSHYLNSPAPCAEIEHAYGPRVHLLNDAYAFSLLSRLCEPACRAPAFHHYTAELYRHLLKAAINHGFPRTNRTTTTRMATYHPLEGSFSAPAIDPTTKVAVVALARAGILPSQVCYERLHDVIDGEFVRQDHISINRKTDAQERVIGTDLGGLKIGGRIEDHIVMLPDPMGATGSTIARTMEVYRAYGKPRLVQALHLVVTPEYLSHVTQTFPEVEVYAIRLDRGLSAPEVLKTKPGTRWPEEKGLNPRQYIVPGAGGIGEVLNNSFV